MTFEPTISLDKTDDLPSSSSLVNHYSQIGIKNDGDQLLLILPTQAEINSELPWSETWQELKHLLQTKEQSWQIGTKVCLVAQDRLLDARQLQTIAETLDDVKLSLSKISTNRRQTAVVAATSGYSVEQIQSVDPLIETLTPVKKVPSSTLAEPLYLQSTVRSGVEIRHPGTIVICGDLNPGGKAIAAGDILVWGRLRGIAHAGAQGNHQSRIAALQMEFTQLRIADAVARSPKIRPRNLSPELAFMTTDGIKLAKNSEFAKNYVFSSLKRAWIDRTANSSYKKSKKGA
ncbi:septum site-determining protein MinC [Waterburya agarophytonicola K14]|uniref:Probable septum site-determining protein MinC n=1 Tax=Waterburya agarophytonicola KI4 TaxID=2874699 RepID=A0A964FHF5_9CYAN|nr:septum site-determining protein MinC [Waterburya agarophytonicola]MCC0179126.1 septum site-determining protein MinC [Waterburya agarophytonicola KI4]